jgi:lipid-A-disaccharide synthase-like uncharacterized protein
VIAMDKLAYEVGAFINYVFKFIGANFLVDGTQGGKELMGYLFIVSFVMYFVVQFFCSHHSDSDNSNKDK